MVDRTGWTWATVDRLTMPQYLALADEWEDHPPVHYLVASYLGIKPKSRAPVSDAENQSALGAILGMFGRQV